MNLFMEVSRLCREDDGILTAKARATSPLLKVQWAEKGIALRESLSALLQDLNASRNALTDQMKYLNVAWESAPPAASPVRVHVLPCGRLESTFYRDLIKLPPALVATSR